MKRKCVISFVLSLVLICSCVTMSIPVISAEEIKVEIPAINGDANRDGKCNIKDATAIQKHIANIAHIEDYRMHYENENECSTEYLEVLKKCNLYCADVNHDGSINVRDATIVQKVVAEILPLEDYFWTCIVYPHGVMTYYDGFQSFH